MRLVCHRATLAGTEDEWREIADHVGSVRLKRAIENGLRRGRRVGYWEGEGARYVYPENPEIMLRFSGGSIRRISEAISILTALDQ